MSNVKKLMMTAASGGGLNVEDVFSTYVYKGLNGTAQSIDNGIDLSGEGGLVWIKQRTQNNYHYLFDTDGTSNTSAVLLPLTSGASASTTALTSFNSDGFSLGSNAGVNGNNDMVSWTFRKAPKFFDIVTATSTGSSNRTLSHNLGCDVGFAVVKRLDGSANWISRHRSQTSGHNINLNTNAGSFAFSGIISFNSSSISINEANFLGTGNDYVVYLFAHNDDNGGFGINGDQDIIKCGTYNGQATVDLGFEPQWLLVKQGAATTSWRLVDNIRGWGFNIDADLFIAPDRIDAEMGSQNWITPTSTGFNVTNSNGNVAGQDMLYIAIRRGLMGVPENATDVFTTDLADNSYGTNGYEYDSGFPVDLAIRGYRHFAGSQYYPALGTRLTTNNYLITTAVDHEQTNNSSVFDYMDGFYEAGQTDIAAWMWRRAPNFCDVVCYTGDGLDGHTVGHSLGVEPEMIWVKRRFGGGSGGTWCVYNKYAVANGDNAPETDFLALNSPQAVADFAGMWYDTAPTSTEFTLGSYQEVNRNGDNFLAILFASLDGISKLGSYTGTGSNQTIDCGFSSGARFVLIKNINASRHWFIWDSARGITSSADPYLTLSSTAGEATNASIDINPHNSGFTVVGSHVNINTSGNEYLFYAIA